MAGLPLPTNTAVIPPPTTAEYGLPTVVRATAANNNVAVAENSSFFPLLAMAEFPPSTMVVLALSPQWQYCHCSKRQSYRCRQRRCYRTVIDNSGSDTASDKRRRATVSDMAVLSMPTTAQVLLPTIAGVLPLPTIARYIRVSDTEKSSSVSAADKDTGTAANNMAAVLLPTIVAVLPLRLQTVLPLPTTAALPLPAISLH